MPETILRAAAAAAAALLPALAVAAPLSFDQALSLAVQRSEAARAGRASALSATESSRAAGQLPDPMLGVGIENLPVTGADRFSTTRESMTMKRVGISQEWLSRDKRVARQAAADAVETWSALHAEVVSRQLPLWTPATPRSDWPELAEASPGAPRVALLFGPPGSGVERIGGLLAACIPAFRRDRFGPRPPDDPLQKYATIAALGQGDDPSKLVAQWREALPSRGVGEGQVIDWLPFWDNVLLRALRAHLPEATLLLAVRDPRDMLLDWLAFGAPMPLALASPATAAHWLASLLNQLAALHEHDLYPHRLLRMDASIDDPQALSTLVGGALGLELPVAPAGALGPKRFPPGHWRAYADALAEPFRLLTPVARRLGYETQDTH